MEHKDGMQLRRFNCCILLQKILSNEASEYRFVYKFKLHFVELILFLINGRDLKLNLGFTFIKNTLRVKEGFNPHFVLNISSSINSKL